MGSPGCPGMSGRVGSGIRDLKLENPDKVTEKVVLTDIHVDGLNVIRGMGIRLKDGLSCIESKLQDCDRMCKCMSVLTLLITKACSL